MTSLQLIIPSKDILDFAKKFSNATFSLRDIFEIDSNKNHHQNSTYNFNTLSKLSNLSNPITSIIPNDAVTIIKANIDDIIYFSENYVEFFQMLNLAPAHWRLLFASMKKDLENMTLSKCLAIIGLNIHSIIHKINFIFTSLSNQDDSKKVTLEALHNGLDFKPSTSYIKLSNILNQLNNSSKIFSPNCLLDLSVSSCIYLYSLSQFLFDFCDSLIISSFSFFRNVLNLNDLPLREKIVLFRKGVEKIRVASDSSLFKRLIFSKVDFLNELSFYASNFLNDDFKMSQFFVDFLKCDKKNYDKEIQNINYYLSNFSVIGGIENNILTRPISNFMTKFSHNFSEMKINASLRIFFTNSESFNDAIQRIVDFSDEHFEIPLFECIQKSLQKIMNEESTFEKEFSFNATKINKVFKDMKEMALSQFLIKYGEKDLSENLNHFGSFFGFFSNLHKKYFPKISSSLFDKFKKICILLKSTETNTVSFFDTIYNGSSIVIDAIFDFTKSIIEKKKPSEVVKSVSKSFIDLEKTVENLINFDKSKKLSFKNFNEAIVIDLKSNNLNFFNILPLDKIYNILAHLAPIAKAKNDISLNDLKGDLNNSINFFTDLSNLIKRCLSMPVIDIYKMTFKRYVFSEIDIDATIEKLKELISDIANDRKIGITKVEQMFVKMPQIKDDTNKRIVKKALPVTFSVISIFVLIVIVVILLSKANKSIYNEEKGELNSDNLTSHGFDENDLLLESNDSHDKL